MLTIRMQRTGRKGYATFRVVVQDSRFSPSSGRVVANLGHYNPHTKEKVIDTKKALAYIKNGAQPTPRVVKLLLAEKVSLPSWVEKPIIDKKGKTKNPEKLRKNQPKKEVEQAIAPEVIPVVEDVKETETEEAIKDSEGSKGAEALAEEKIEEEKSEEAKKTPKKTA